VRPEWRRCRRWRGAAGPPGRRYLPQVQKQVAKRLDDQGWLRISLCTCRRIAGSSGAAITSRRGFHFFPAGDEVGPIRASRARRAKRPQSTRAGYPHRQRDGVHGFEGEGHAARSASQQAARPSCAHAASDSGRESKRCLERHCSSSGRAWMQQVVAPVGENYGLTWRSTRACSTNSARCRGVHRFPVSSGRRKVRAGDSGGCVTSKAERPANAPCAPNCSQCAGTG